MTVESGIATMNGVFVSVYKFIGFVVLTCVVVGLVSYLGVNGFFLVNRSWVASAVVSKTDDRVLQLRAQLAAHEYQRDRLVIERDEVLARANDARRVLAAEEAYQAQFAAAIVQDVSVRVEELERTTAIQQEYEQARAELGRAGDDYSRLWREQAHKLREAKLIDQEQALAIEHGLSQIGINQVTLLEKESNLRSRQADLMREIAALRLAKRGVDRSVDRKRLTYEALQRQQQLVRSVLEAEKLRDQVAVYDKNLEALDRAIDGYDSILAAIRETPRLRAVEGALTVAFVPYENLDGVTVGAPLYGCRASFVWCRPIGEVVNLLDGEVVANHPLTSRPMRGLLVETHLNKPGWEKEDVLFAGRAPMLF